MWSQFWNILLLTLYLVNLVVSITASCIIVYKREDPIKTLSWVIVILSVPYLGLIGYIFLGRNFRKEKMFSRKGAGDSRFRRKRLTRKEMEDLLTDSPHAEEIRPLSKIIIQNFNSSRSRLLTNREVHIYFSGKEALEAMCQAMEEARHHIHLQSFIIEDDRTGRRFKEILIRKAKAGVEVRLMFDGFGSRNLGKEFLRELADSGVEVLNFSPFRLLFPPPIVNYRNHRKILVVDGNTGFLGGVNIADRYYDGGSFPEWRDTHVRLTGESVYALQESFLLDRFFIQNKRLKRRKRYYPDVSIREPEEGKQHRFFTQVISSGPDSDWSGILQCYLSAISVARHHIYIITPYFIPSNTILDAIRNASLSGVDVRLMIPERSDTWLTHWSTMSYLSELIFAGVKVYLFQRGFNHSKVLSIDSEFCIIGSANMDNRSLEHNFEVTSVLYNRECAQTIESQFEKDRHRCTLVTRTEWEKRGFKHKAMESLARLISPML